MKSRQYKLHRWCGDIKYSPTLLSWVTSEWTAKSNYGFQFCSFWFAQLSLGIPLILLWSKSTSFWPDRLLLIEPCKYVISHHSISVKKMGGKGMECQLPVVIPDKKN